MPSYKLYYFNGRGRAELSRLLFAAAGQTFKDERLEGEEWKAFKPKTPMGQLPCLDVDGLMFCQSKPIADFLAKEFGLHGKDNVEQLKLNMVLEVITDIAEALAKVMFEKDDTKKTELMTKIKTETMPKNLKLLEEQLKQSGGDYFGRSRLTIADLMVFNILEQCLKKDPNLLKDFPRLRKNVEKVQSTPKIAAYLKNRKETPW